MAKSVIYTNHIYFIIIICVLVGWFFRRQTTIEPPDSSTWRPPLIEGGGKGNSVSLRDCIKSMSMAFLLGGGATEIDITHKVYPSSKSHYRHSNSPKTSSRDAIRFNSTSPKNEFRLDQQGRSYRIGRGGRKIYKRKKLGERIRKVVAASQKWRCYDCGELLPAAFEGDHVVPISQGGSSHPSNLQSLCRNCHGSRTTQQGIAYNF